MHKAISKTPRDKLNQSAERRSAATLKLSRRRASMVVYRVVEGQARFLLISSARRPDRLTLPGGKVSGGESPVDAALRETAEEAGIVADRPEPLGNYLHRKSGRRVHPTDTFLAHFAGTLSQREDRRVFWLTAAQLIAEREHIRPGVREQLAEAVATLERRRVAA